MVEQRTATRSRRSDILAAAEREFAEAGYAGARIDRIAAQAGVNKQLLFHYFDSKSGLFSAVLDTVFGRHDPGPAAADDPAAAMRAWLGALEVLARSNSGLVAILMASNDHPAVPADASSAAHAWLERVHGRIAESVEEAQRRGYYRDDIDPAQVARLAIGAALGVGAFSNGAAAGSLAPVLQEYCAWR